MPQTQINCPRCKNPVVADINQLFDMGSDPQAKAKLLSGGFNIVQCPSCGFQGMISSPIVYHDPDKELLLTYFPPEMNIAVNEQERQIGPLINLAINRLPAEKRKGYLFRPQTMLTLQTMLERILEADGITREMIETQQKQMNLLQQLMKTPPENRADLIKKEENIINESFFALISRLAEVSMAQGDEKSARALAEVQKELLNQTEVGRVIKSQAQEAQEAVKSLQDASKDGLTREKLLDLIINAKTETRLSTLVSLAYSGLDYQFFQLLSERVDKATGEEQQRLASLRDSLLQMTKEIEKAIQEQMKAARQLLDKVMAAPNIEEAIGQNAGQINEMFVEVLRSELDSARKQGNLERSSKLSQINEVIEKASAPPPEFAIIEELLSASDEQSRQQILQAHTHEITPEFLQLLHGVVTQSQQQGQPAEAIDELQKIYKQALRFSMQINLSK